MAESRNCFDNWFEQGEGKKGIRSNIQVLCLSYKIDQLSFFTKNRLPFSCSGEDEWRKTLGRKKRVLIWIVKFERPVGHPSGNVPVAVG